jgi:alpha-ribazole phosphatase CobZ
MINLVGLSSRVLKRVVCRVGAGSVSQGEWKRPALQVYLEKKGVRLDEMVEAALELFVPHPGVENKEKATRVIKEEFEDALSDVNVSTLVVACYRAEEDARKGRIPGLTRERFTGRPGLVADELLGMTIANYIAGARGIFEFVRFDQSKPGILKDLGPITNDAVGGLIAGCSSNMYTRATRESEMR